MRISTNNLSRYIIGAVVGMLVSGVTITLIQAKDPSTTEVTVNQPAIPKEFHYSSQNTVCYVWKDSISCVKDFWHKSTEWGPAAVPMSKGKKLK